MNFFSRSKAPLISSIVVLVLTTLALELWSLYHTGWHFCYPLDDTFIHMAVAKTFANHGVWGLGPESWVSTSSSPLFTATLALSFKLFGSQIFLPFLIALAGGILSLVAIDKELARFTDISPASKTLIMLAVLFLGALPSLCVLGMEHTLQIAFALLFFHRSGDLLANHSITRRDWLTTALVGACMIITRYENVFMVIFLCAILFFRRSILQSIVIGIIALMPIAIFGWIMYRHGSFVIPNSILIKGNQDAQPLIGGQHSILSITRTITGLLVIAIALIFEKTWQRNYDRDFWLLLSFVVTGILHSLFASFGWFFRYEAYLIVIGSLLLLRIAFQRLTLSMLKQANIRLMGLFVFILVFNLPLRALSALYNTSRAYYNIYEQQYQMGHFIRSAYAGTAIAANDIGAISYFADVRTIDLWGLASNEVTKARRVNNWTAPFLDSLVRSQHCQVMIIYDSWFERSHNHPTTWVKAATWTLPYNYICGDITVSFYALTNVDAEQLRQKLQAFKTRLPNDITVAYFQ